MGSSDQKRSASMGADASEAVWTTLFRPLGVDGVYARNGIYVQVLEGLEAFITRNRPAGAEVVRFPPVMSRAQLEKSGYLKSFPNLLGCVCALHGTQAEIRAAADAHEQGGSWTASLSPSDLVLSPAACYPVYPIAAARGPLPQSGWLFDVEADCFRHEPSRALDRLQSFRMREFVRIGSPQAIQAFREEWMARAQKLAEELGAALSAGHRQRSLLRPRRPGDGRGPETAVAEVRAAGPLSRRRDPDRVHELQLSSRAFRRHLGHARCAG